MIAAARVVESQSQGIVRSADARDETFPPVRVVAGLPGLIVQKLLNGALDLPDRPWHDWNDWVKGLE